MKIITRLLIFANAAIKSYGPSWLKKTIWDREYLGDKWAFADDTIRDCIYSYLVQYTRGGTVLDLGCGSGNTSNEIPLNAYKSYLGVDISQRCLDKARQRSRRNRRASKNVYMCGDILTYTPPSTFDVILFRESLYHVPHNRLTPTLARYSQYLTPGGVLIVRLATAAPDGPTKARPAAMLNEVESHFDILEKRHYRETGATVLVFRSQMPIPAQQL